MTKSTHNIAFINCMWHDSRGAFSSCLSSSTQQHICSMFEERRNLRRQLEFNIWSNRRVFIPWNLHAHTLISFIHSFAHLTSTQWPSSTPNNSPHLQWTSRRRAHMQVVVVMMRLRCCATQWAASKSRWAQKYAFILSVVNTGILRSTNSNCFC